MQSTIIRIKFMALVRNLENNDKKWLLEIVPDVSCIENIDKMKWNEETKLVEYSVPVTYKIILKKETNKNQEKIYYSCIDFRQLSTDSNLACGDVAKVFSDNFILRAVTSNFAKNVSKPCPFEVRNDEIMIHEPFSTNKTRDFRFNKNEIKNKHLKETSFAPKAVETDKDDCDLNDGNRIIIKPFGVESAVSKQTITDMTEIRSDQEKKKKLTITSICTLNAINIPAKTTLYKETKNYSKIKQIENKNKCNINTNKCLYEEKEKLSPHNPVHMFDEIRKANINKVIYKRILPDTRVAHFMMSVEDEILPLRIMLSEIYRKCTLLGLFWNSNVFQSCKQKCSHNNKMFIQSKPKCNRVVYSVVFEE